MRTCRRALTVLALSLAPLAVWAAVPVEDSNSGYNNSGSSYPPAGYGTNGAYAGGAATSAPSAQGELFNQLQRMQDQIAQQQGAIEVLQNQVNQLKQEGLERYKDLDQRIGAGVQPAATPDNSPAGGAPSAAAGAAAGAAASQAPAASSEPGDPAKEKLYYDAAFDLIKAKDFDKASQAFTAFLRKYPNSQYAGNAQYWLGEVNLAKGDLQGAGQAFAKVSQLYPKHAKVPDSLYKLADVERRLGHTDKVKGILQQVVAQYPGTSAAQLAQRDLQRL
ncbi:MULTISPECIES: tol-pal system protein YbgF [Pseudomonas]|uniref:Cell division coordinator CpoB n=1 Tax=Pseudomonas extremorientalis TaxID=169669 RepID=A0A1H0PTN9_9PSED|nr:MULTISPECIES: tol-pal system protein YbgF [Pseudomonas]KAB0521978.1 tol-pal system protein YbgF [Pseudomonas extremorientalis]OIN10839.1 tol-pal system protein YbgF [Pseudomonas extremorientalis]PMV23064.1 tol-pal system protein YbgF [Pseudomonas sp. FW305-3-2-15-C-TSA2]PMV29740.1 tol-pal system protein YbgF [Pseudomonas sp. DP16D-L5]PMV39893.1 tol-pal system protein YbgF [Pseudomonas sp. FW305-3-2-15-A-LB2]